MNKLQKMKENRISKYDRIHTHRWCYLSEKRYRIYIERKYSGKRKECKTNL